MNENNEPIENNENIINVLQTELIELRNNTENLKNELSRITFAYQTLRIENTNLNEQIRNQAQNQVSIKNTNNDINKEIDTIINLHSVEYIKSAMFYIKIWNFFTGFFITFKYIILIMIVPTLTFASTTYTQYSLNFIAGISSLTGLAFEKMGRYCEINSKRRVEKLNKILKEHGNNTTIQDDSEFDVELKRVSALNSDSSPDERKSRVIKLKSNNNIQKQSDNNSAKNVCIVAIE